jgi:hypothetical protein
VLSGAGAYDKAAEKLSGLTVPGFFMHGIFYEFNHPEVKGKCSGHFYTRKFSA